MSTVYIVTIRQWEDVEIRGVFSTQEKAQEFQDALAPAERINSTIASWEVDHVPAPVDNPRYVVTFLPS